MVPTGREVLTTVALFKTFEKIRAFEPLVTIATHVGIVE